ncbi:hypothetical protein CGCF413_v000219 [Colletotrichum fructicola]|nr:hypothetical protein CGCF413_v000219 [Colletotrichum fructicola]
MILTITYRLWQVLWSLLPTSTTPAQMREMLPPDSYLHQRVAIQSRRFDAIASRNSHRTAIFMGSIRQRAAGLRVRRIFRSRTDQLTSIINPIFFACAPS